MYRRVFLIVLTFCTQLCAQIVATRCDGGELPETATPAAALAYLSQDRTNLNSACIINSIRIIREKNYRLAIPILVKYLDFRVPDTPGVRRTVRHTQGPTNGLYPATDALAWLGETAVPALKSAISNNDLGAIGRSNAAKALFLVAADQAQVVSLTMKAAQASQDPDATDVLKKVANEMVRYCKAEEQQRCKDAVDGD
jgi:hypothetical protein